MKTINGYEKEINELWKIKEEIYSETKDMNMDDFIRYISKNTTSLKERFKDKFVNNHNNL